MSLFRSIISVTMFIIIIIEDRDKQISINIGIK